MNHNDFWYENKQQQSKQKNKMEKEEAIIKVFLAISILIQVKVLTNFAPISINLNTWLALAFAGTLNTKDLNFALIKPF